MKSFNTFLEEEYLNEEVTNNDLKEIEKFADELFAKFKIDVEFSKHFKDRINDPRNKKPITKQEMIDFFQRAFKKYGGKIRQLGKDAQAVLTQLSTNINLPFALKFDPKSGELELVSKTIMRKKNFTTPNDKLTFQ